MTQTKVIDTTVGPITTRLTVYRDWIESNGKWRLFWEDIDEPGAGFEEQSTVTGQPFFPTMKAAIAYGIKRYGIQAIRRQY